MIADLRAHEVHLWYVEKAAIDAHTLTSTYDNLLAQEEKERCDRFRHVTSRERYLIARWLLRTSLSRYVDIDPRDWQFSKNQFGRPEIALPNLSALRFNLSYSGEAALLGVAWARDIGVDLEYVNTSIDVMQLARHHFAPLEVEQLESVPDKRRRDLFFTIWTLKEAYVKARGMGLSFPLKEFAVFPNNDHGSALTASLAWDPAPESWWLTERRISRKYHAALVVRSGSRPTTTLVCRCLNSNHIAHIPWGEKQAQPPARRKVHELDSAHEPVPVSKREGHPKENPFVGLSRIVLRPQRISCKSN